MSSDGTSFSLTRDSLMALSAGADSYRFLSLGLVALEQLPEDAQLRLQIVRHYAMLGLSGPAMEMARSLPEPILRQLESAGAIRQLEGVLPGQVPWDRLAGRFEANLRVLAGRFPELEQVAQDWTREGGKLELYRCRDGNYQVCRRDDFGRRVWLPRLLDHKGDTERAPIPGLTDTLMPPPYLLEGVGLGWYLPRLVEATAKRFLNYSPAIYVLEPNPLALAVALHLHDWRSLLADERLFVLAGADCGDRYVELLSGDAALPTPRQHVTLLGWGPKLEPRPADRVGEISRRRDARCLELLGEVQKLYAGCDAAYWARRYVESCQLSVVSCQLLKPPPRRLPL